MSSQIETIKLMMSKKNTSVAFLLSEENNWIREYLHTNDLKNSLEDIKIFYDKKMVTGYKIVFILGYTKILDANFLRSNELNLVIHESPLPYGKGFSPVQWQILDGCNEIIVSLIEATNDVDGGDIILQTELKLNGTELYNEIREKQAKASISLIKNFLSKYPNFNKEEQQGRETFFPKRKPEDSELDVNKTIRDQFNNLRIGNNDSWPSFFRINGKKFIIKIFDEHNENE